MTEKPDGPTPLERGIAYLEGDRSRESTAADSHLRRLSRRKVLAGLATVTTAGALSGAGTRAFSSDLEIFGGQGGVEGNQLESGTFDLRLAWEERYNGDTLETGGTFPPSDPAKKEDFIDNDSPVVTLDGIKPGDEGTVTTALHLFDNPGCVWMRLIAHDYDDNGLSPNEESAGDTTGGDGEGELQDHLDVSVWYDRNCDGTLDEGECTIASGSLATVTDTLERGVLLDARGYEGDGCPTCRELEKLEWVEYDDSEDRLEPEGEDGDLSAEIVGGDYVTETDDTGTYAFSEGDEHVTTLRIEVTDRDDDDQPRELSYEVVDGASICQTEVKGGSSVAIIESSCVRRDEGLHALTNSSGNVAGISNITFYYCPGEKRCFTNSTTYCVGFEWSLPEGATKRVETDSVQFELEFVAEQSRHNHRPTNPWGDAT